MVLVALDTTELLERTVPELGTERLCVLVGLLGTVLLLPEGMPGFCAVVGFVVPGVPVGLLLAGCEAVGLAAGAGYVCGAPPPEPADL